VGDRPEEAHGHGTQVAASRAEEGLGSCRLKPGYTRAPQMRFSRQPGLSPSMYLHLQSI
jgi:hypothetical protein